MPSIELKLTPARATSATCHVIFVDREGDELTLDKVDHKEAMLDIGGNRLAVDGPDQLEQIAAVMMQAADQWRAGVEAAQAKEGGQV